MFHWICPECGREIPPAVRECPACDPQSKQNSEAVSQTAEVRAEAAPPSAVTLPVPVLSNKLAEAEPAKIDPPKMQPEPALEPLLVLAEQVRAAQIAEPQQVTAGLGGLAAAVGVSPAPPAPPAPEPVAAAQTPAPEPTTPAAQAPAPEPVASAVQAPAQQTMAVPTPQVVQPVALLAQPVALLAPPVEQPAPAALAHPIPAVPPKPAAPAPTADPVKITAAPEIEQAPPLVRETSADKPPSGSWLRLAPLQDYSAAASRGMNPVVPLPKILMPDSGPRITLPGPMLPPELQMRKDLHVVTMIGGVTKRKSLPGWVVSAMVIVVMLGAGILMTVYLMPASHSTADAKAPVPEPVETAAPVESSHPLAEYVEVTGFRFIMDLNKKSEVHYLVVNHSPSELTDMTIFVTVKAASAKAGQPPVCRFSFRSPGLGPFESKEMVSSIEKLSRPVAVPDWHDLRAEVQISQ